ncbi:hypothetical protein [Planctobacterium marinum]|uniref:DUF3108 domain-containing protein n=1 Tax=Planctobacterium marinum TaxID=1631968 RepID=A0AA48HS61_9ALTE|nr:hypothetical protein MACH26_25100 [Planctobacterium marinum]
MLKRVLTTLFTVASISIASEASDVVPSVAHISSYQATYDYYSLGDHQQKSYAGRWTDEVIINQATISRTVERKTPEGETDLIRTVVADAKTLAPVFLQQRFGKNLQSVFYSDFQQSTLQQFFLSSPDAAARRLATPLSQTPVEVNLQGLLAAALPLKQQNSITVTSYVAGAAPAITQTTFEVTGKETITIHGENFETWKIHEPQSQWTYWVQSEFPYLIQVLHPSPSGEMLLSEIKSGSQQ